MVYFVSLLRAPATARPLDPVRFGLVVLEHVAPLLVALGRERGVVLLEVIFR